MNTKSLIATFLVGFFLLTSPSYAQISIESSQLERLDEQTEAKIAKSLLKEHANYHTCSFQGTEINLKGKPSRNALFLTTTPDCWGAWQGPLWLLQIKPDGSYDILLHTISYKLKFSEETHNGLNDLIFTAGSAEYSTKEIWRYNRQTFDKTDSIINDAFNE